eukprot:11461708-Alexandrium_andersonii.AAC.1
MCIRDRLRRVRAVPEGSSRRRCVGARRGCASGRLGGGASSRPREPLSLIHISEPTRLALI